MGGEPLRSWSSRSTDLTFSLRPLWMLTILPILFWKLLCSLNHLYLKMMPHLHFWGKRGSGMGDTDCFRQSQLVRQLKRFSFIINAAQENCCARWNPASRGFKNEDVLFCNSMYVMNMNEISIPDSSITSAFPLSLVNELQVMSFSFFVLQFWRVCCCGKEK